MATQVTSSLIDYTSSSFTGNFRNRIINGNFDVWQRSTSLGPGFGDRFLADRFLTRSSSSTYTTAQVALNFGELPGTAKYYHRNEVTTGSTTGRYCYLVHRIENVRTFAGSTATLSFYAKANAARNVAVEIAQSFGNGGSPSPQVNTYVDTFALTTAWQKFTVTVSVPPIVNKIPGTHSSFLGLHFWFDAGSDPTLSARTNNLGPQSGIFDITQVQFEEGPVATPFEERFTGTEIALCQRYYQSETDRLHYFPAGDLSEATHDIRISPMRLTPTVSGSLNLGSTHNLVAGTPSFVVGMSPEKIRFIGDHSSTPGKTSGVAHYSWTADAEIY